MTEIDFDDELAKGVVTYEKKLGSWWTSRAVDRSHALAYTRIARFISENLSPESIIDYACGNGMLLSKLSSTFPNATLFGIDGSRFLLEQAKKRVSAKFEKSSLPNFDLKYQADLIVFCFPNIVPNPNDQPYYDKHGYKDPSDKLVATYLAKAREPDPEDETVVDDIATLKDVLLTNKVISRNLHGLIKPGGYCIRIEYANASREELTPLVEARTAFEEGSLEEIDGKRPIQLFKKVKSQFFNSKVIEDVFHQTQDESDKKGGFFITLLQKI